MIFSNKRNQAPWGKWLIIGLREKVFKMNSGDPVMPESREVLKTQTGSEA